MPTLRLLRRAGQAGGLILLCGLGGQVMGATTGAVECPCITSTSPHYGAISAAVARQNGLPSNYGLEGCMAYDKDVNHPMVDCASNEHGYCSAEWCYIDYDKCAVNEDACKAAGGQMNSRDHPACRERESSVSRMLTNLSSTIMPRYSYSTCGNLNNYDESIVTSKINGYRVYTASSPLLPYIKEVSPNEFSGPLFMFAMDMLAQFNPVPTHETIPSFASEESKKLFNSSYTACAHDVAIGRLDMCVADIWITPERQKWVDFIPAIRQDNMFLVVQVEGTAQKSFADLMKNQIIPFEFEVWVAIVVVITVAAAVAGFCDYENENDYPYGGHHYILRGFKALYLSTSSFLNGVPISESTTVPAKIASIGYNWFILIILASYTANLATLLVVQGQSKVSVQSLDEAVMQGYKVCVTNSMVPILQKVYAAGNFVEMDGDGVWAPRMIHSGKCDAAVMSEVNIANMHANTMKSADCAAVEEGLLTEDEARCNEGFDGAERDDCKLVKVGPIVISMPIAFPVRKGLAQALSWATIQAQNQGKWVERVKQFEQDSPKSKCLSSSAPVKTLRLDISAFWGTILSTGVIMFIAVLLAIIEKRKKVPLENLLSSGLEDHQAETEASSDTKMIMDKLKDLEEKMKEQYSFLQSSESISYSTWVPDTPAGKAGIEFNRAASFSYEGAPTVFARKASSVSKSAIQMSQESITNHQDGAEPSLSARMGWVSASQDSGSSAGTAGS